MWLFIAWLEGTRNKHFFSMSYSFAALTINCFWCIGLLIKSQISKTWSSWRNYKVDHWELNEVHLCFIWHLLLPLEWIQLALERCGYAWHREAILASCSDFQAGLEWAWWEVGRLHLEFALIIAAALTRHGRTLRPPVWHVSRSLGCFSWS